MSNGPYQQQRIRIPLSLFGSLNDQVTGGAVQFCTETDIQFELLALSQNLPIDASDIASISLAIKPGNNIDATPVFSGTVTPGSSGWNSNPVLTAGQQVVPGYAYYNATGSGATATATESGGAVQLPTVGAGGSGYTTVPTVWIVSSNGAGSGASCTAVLTNGVVTGFTSLVGGAGYTASPLVFIVAAAPSYTVGVQAGATYMWASGVNDLTLTNGTSLVTGSNIVNSTSLNGVSYSGAGAATLSGLTAGNFYYFLLGANDTSVAGLTKTAPPYFLAAGSTAALAGTASSLVGSQVYPAAAGANIVGGALTYQSSTSALVASGNSLVGNVITGTNYAAGAYTQANALVVGNTYYWTKGANDATCNGLSASGSFLAASTTLSLTGTSTSAITATVVPYYGAAATGTTYGTFLLTNLVAGATYAYTLGLDEPSPQGGVAGNTSTTGYFTPSTTTALLTGLPSTKATVAIYTTTGSYVQSGLTIGSTYYWTKGADDTKCGTLSASGFFNATASQVTLTGLGGAAVTAQLQLITPVTTSTFVAAADTVTFAGSVGSVTASLTGSVGWNSYNDQTCVIPFNHTTTNIAAGSYWCLVTATTLSGNDLNLGAGNITVVDQGEATPTVVPGNIVPGGAMYDGSGNYTLSGLISGGIYYWQKNADDTGCAGLTSSGNFIAAGTTQVLTGTPSSAVTAVVVRLFVSNPTGGAIAYPNGATGLQTVTGLTIPFVPTFINIWWMAGATDGIVPIQVVYSSISQTGFQFNIVGVLTSANYVLGWTAY